MPPFGHNGNSYESIHNSNNNSKMSRPKDDDGGGSIGSDTFREQRRRAYDECETDEQLFNQHNNLTSIFDNRHHDIELDDDLNSAGSSLGGYSNLDDDNSKGGSVRTREELRLSLVNRRRRLAQMENAMDGDGSVDFSLRLTRRPNKDSDGRSLVSSLRDSIISLNDSLQDSLLSRRKKKKSKDKKKKKKKSSSKDKEREKRKEKERKEKERKAQKKVAKQKKKEKHHKSKKDDKKSSKKKKSKRYDSSDDEDSSSSSESESDVSVDEQPRRRSSGDDRDRRQQQRRQSESTRKIGRGGRPNFACDERTGMCSYHPDVQLRKRSRATGGWKDVMKSCPKCARDAKRGIDRSERSAGTGRRAGGGQQQQRDGGDRRRGSDGRGVSRQPSTRPRHPDARRRKAVDSESSSASSSSSSAPKKGQRPANRRGDPSRRDNMGERRSGDPSGGTSQPPRRAGRPSAQNGAPPKRAPGSRSQSMRPGTSGRQGQDARAKSSRQLSSRDPQNGRDARKMGRDGKKGPPPTRTGRERSTPSSNDQQPPRHRGHSSQRIANNVDFDPPANFRFSIGGIEDNPVPRQDDDMSRGIESAIGSESDFALFRGKGGKAYNEDGMFSFFRDQKTIRQDVSPIEEEKKMNSSLSGSGHQVAGRNLYDDYNVQKMKSKTFHGMSGAAPAKDSRHRRKSFTANLEGISRKVLMNFVLAESAHFDQPLPENTEDLERALMEQVARLSIGSVNGDLSEQDLGQEKFAVLREVVKSYMMNASAKNVNSKDRSDRTGGESVGRSLKSKQRPAYNLGDEGKRRDMIKDDDKDVALMRIASLQPDDPAFIRRTTGKWTFAKVKTVDSDSIMFIVNESGSSKAYAVKYWVSHVRTLKVSR